MAHPNQERLRKGFEAFNQGDIETVLSLLDEGIVWHVPGRGPLGGDYKGTEEVLGLFGQVAQLSGGTFAQDLEYVLTDDEIGFAMSVATAERPGKAPLRNRDLWCFRLMDGKLVEVWEATADLYESDEFWGD